MKSAIFFASILILLAGCGAQKQSGPAETTLKIASFNMAFCRDTLDLKIWEARKNSIMPVLEAGGFDICGSQEPYAFQVKFLAARAPQYGYVCGLLGDETPEKFAARPPKYHKRELVLPNMNNPIWYKKDKFDVLESGKFWYSKTPEKQSGGWEEDRWDAERTCVWAKFREKKTLKEFYVFNSHWLVAQNPRDAESVKSARLLLAKIKEIARGGAFFAMGDFNATDEFDSIKLLKSSGIMDSAKDSAKIGDPDAKKTFVGFYGESKKPVIIDHIFASKNVKIESFKVGGYAPLDGAKANPSDHLPIMATARF